MSVEFENDESDDAGTYVYFGDGIISWYHIDSYGYGDLNKENTRKLYEAMKEYYEDSK